LEIVNNVRMALVILEDYFRKNAPAKEELGCAAGCLYLEAHFDELGNYWHNSFLVRVVYRNEDRAFDRQAGTRRRRSLAERLAEAFANTDDLACALHLGTEHGVSIPESVETEHCFLHSPTDFRLTNSDSGIAKQAL